MIGKLVGMFMGRKLKEKAVDAVLDKVNLPDPVENAIKVAATARVIVVGSGTDRSSTAPTLRRPPVVRGSPNTSVRIVVPSIGLSSLLTPFASGTTPISTPPLTGYVPSGYGKAISMRGLGDSTVTARPADPVSRPGCPNSACKAVPD